MSNISRGLKNVSVLGGEPSLQLETLSPPRAQAQAKPTGDERWCGKGPVSSRTRQPPQLSLQRVHKVIPGHLTPAKPVPVRTLANS